MSDKRAKLRERSQRFRRRISGKDRAVSPVVATLILILIAVAAAAALYLWLVTWQGSITSGIGNPHAQPTLTIGGSTSVYPFDEIAVTQFQQNNTDVVISNNQGGSGAGMIAVCDGNVNLGAASFPVDAATLVSTYGCSPSIESTVSVTTVAYDAVDVIVPSANTHGLLSINYDTLALVYADGTAATGATPKLIPATENGIAIPASTPIPSAILAAPGTFLAWNQIPAAVEGAPVGTYTQAVASGATWTGAACGTGVLANAECYTTGGTAASTCGFIVCATGAQQINTWARSDASGTTQSFEARLLDATSSSGFGSVSTLSAPTTGFSGCGSSNYISDCGYVATHTGNGNPGVIAGVAGDANGIGYASDGLARASGSGVGLVAYTGVGQSYTGATPDGAIAAWYGGILPTTGGSGTIALGIKAATVSNDYYTGYLGWRPFDIVSLNTPQGTAAAFLTFVTDPANNINIAGEAQEVSIYSV
jgi:flagellin-like protein